MTATSAPAERGTALRRDAIGLPEVLFQSITHMAPAVATALSIGAATGFALKLTPLAVVFAMVACLFTAYSIGQLGRHLPSAGGMYTYVSHGLGPFFGWLVAWAFALAEPLVAPILLAAFGLYGGIFLSTYLHIGADFKYLWIVLAIACGLVLWWLVYSGIQLSARTGVVLGIIEIAIFVFVSALLVANAGQVVSRDAALEAVWGEGRLPTANTVDRYVAYLRRKLGPPALIHTVRGVGFVLRG